jgi:hypothetical protein
MQLTINQQTLNKIFRLNLYFSLIILLLLSCNNEKNKTKDYKEIDSSYSDTADFKTAYSNSVFCIPSPQLTNMYFKHLGIYPDRTLVNSLTNTEKYTTSTKKAINLGIFGVDLGYMNMFTVSESTNDYIAAISQLSNDIGLGLIFTREVYDKVMSLKSNQDSLAQYLSMLFAKTDLYLKNNSQEQISAFVITGGWIESFYLLCSIYSQTRNKDILPFLYQQKFVLDNIIKNLSPYYKKTQEMESLINDLVEIAYEFDILDFRYSYEQPFFTINSGVMVFKNSCIINGSESGLSNLFKKIDDLRFKITS